MENKVTSVKENILDLFMYIIENSPVDQHVILSDYSQEKQISERTVRRNIKVLKSKGLIKSTKAKYQYSEIIEPSDKLIDLILNKYMDRSDKA